MVGENNQTRVRLTVVWFTLAVAPWMRHTWTTLLERLALTRRRWVWLWTYLPIKTLMLVCLQPPIQCQPRPSLHPNSRKQLSTSNPYCKAVWKLLLYSRQIFTNANSKWWNWVERIFSPLYWWYLEMGNLLKMSGSTQDNDSLSGRKHFISIPS